MFQLFGQVLEKWKRTDIKENHSSAEEDENILDYSTDSSSDNDDGNNVIDNSKLNIEKEVCDGPVIRYSLYSRIVAKFCLWHLPYSESEWHLLKFA